MKKPNRFLSLSLSSLMLLNLLPAAAWAEDANGFDNFQAVNSYAHAHFTDSQPTDWFYENVKSAYELGLMVGQSDTSFGAGENLTIAETMTIAARLHTTYCLGKANFAPSTPWYAVYVDYCKANNIADSSYYNVEALATRAQFAAIMANALPDEALPAINTVADDVIPDVKIADSYGAAVYKLYRAGIVVGNDDKGTFAPDTYIKRREMAAISTRMANPSLRQSIQMSPTNDVTQEYTVSFDLNYGQKALTSQTIQAGEKATAPVKPERSGYSFKGWYTSSTDGQAFDFNTAITANTTLYAQWTSNSGGSDDSSSGSSSSGSSTYTISTSGTTLSNKTYKNVTIAASVGDGDVTLDNVTIKGTLRILGGGSNTIEFKGCTLNGKVSVEKKTGEPPRLELTNTPVKQIVADQPVIVEATDAASEIAQLEAAANVEVRGETTIQEVSIPSSAASTVTLAVQDGHIASVKAESAVQIAGNGTGQVAEVIAKAPIEISSDVVAKVEIPADADQDIAVTVNGEKPIEVVVNSEYAKVAITAEDAEVTVSSDLETAPEVKINDEVAHVHKWDAGVITQEATCDQEGIKTYTCIAEGCGEPAATKEEALPKVDHKYGEPTYEWAADYSTCTATRVCEDNPGHIDTEIATTSYAVTTPAGCEKAGVGTYTASFANTAFATQTKDTAIEALGHDYSVAQYDATGHWTKCSRCDNTTAVIPHSYDTQDCGEAAKCQSCDYEKPAGAHSYGAYTPVTPATCEIPGSEEAVCTSCGHKDVREIPALGHDYSEPTYEWAADYSTCTATRVCANDAGHTEFETVTPTYEGTKADCENAGAGTYTASFANTAFATQTKAVEIPAFGHDYQDGICSRCGEKEPVFCTVRFLNGDEVLSAQQVEQGAIADVPENPTKAGYSFLDWDIDVTNMAITSDLDINARFVKDGQPTFIISNVTTKAGSDDVAVTIAVKNNPGIASLKMLVNLDNDFTVKSIVYETPSGQSVQPQDLSKRPIALTWLSPLADVGSDWNFVTLHLAVADAAAAGKHNISLTYDPDDVYNLAEENIEFAVVDGCIYVAE